MFLRKCSEIQEDTDTNTSDTIQKKKKKPLGRQFMSSMRISRKRGRCKKGTQQKSWK